MTKTKSDKLAKAYDDTIKRIWETFFPGIDIDVVVDMQDAASVAQLPIKKCTPACPLYDKCEVRQQYQPSQCPMEFVKFFEQLSNMVQELGISPDNVVEASRALDYQILCLLQDAIMEKIHRDGIDRIVPVVSGDGVVAELDEVSPFVKALLEISKLKGRILEEFLATRRSRKQFGSAEEDPALLLSGEVIDVSVEEEGGDDQKAD